MTREETKKAIEVMQAFIDGKEIECYYSGSQTWEKNCNPSWNFYDLKYRIKSEPKLRPYKDSEEFLEAQQNHGLYLDLYGNFYLPTLITGEGVIASESNIDPWKSILKYYKWQDVGITDRMIKSLQIMKENAVKFVELKTQQ